MQVPGPGIYLCIKFYPRSDSSFSRIATMKSRLFRTVGFSRVVISARSFVIFPDSMVEIVASSSLSAKFLQFLVTCPAHPLLRRAPVQANIVATELVDVLFAVQMLVVMTLNGAVSRLIFIVSVRRHQDRGHHCQRTESGRDHIAHHIPVIILAGPDKTSLCLHDSRDSVIDQRIEVGDSRLLKFFFVILLIQICKEIFEANGRIFWK